MSKKTNKDYRDVELILNVSDKVICMYAAMQMLLKNVYISCVRRKVDYIRFYGAGGYPKAYTLPYHEKYCISAATTGFTCKYGHVEYKHVPNKALDRVLWYAECDAQKVLHYLATNNMLLDTLEREDIYTILQKLNRGKSRLLYQLDRPVIAIPAGSTIIQQALYGKGYHPIGSFMLPVVKWDVPIHVDSLQWLREHFPQITCKIEMMYLYVSVLKDGRKVLCVLLRYVNKFDETNINTIGELVYHDPYVITHPNKTMTSERYPMLVREKGYKFKNPYDYYMQELYITVKQILKVDSLQGVKISNKVWLEATDICAKRYQDERKNKNRKTSTIPDTETSSIIHTSNIETKPLTF